MNKPPRPPRPPLPSKSSANERMRLTEEQRRGTRLSKVEGDLDDFKGAVQQRDVEFVVVINELRGELADVRTCAGIIVRELGGEKLLPEPLRTRMIPKPPPGSIPPAPLVPAMTEAMTEAAAADSKKSRRALIVAALMILAERIGEKILEHLPPIPWPL